jgi:hypothetical protein
MISNLMYTFSKGYSYFIKNSPLIVKSLYLNNSDSMDTLDSDCYSV